MGRGVGRGEGGGVQTVPRDKVYLWPVILNGLCVYVVTIPKHKRKLPQQRRGRTREMARTGFCLVPGLKCHGFGYQHTVYSMWEIYDMLNCERFASIGGERFR
jgi:hypothetical protein